MSIFDVVIFDEAPDHARRRRPGDPAWQASRGCRRRRQLPPTSFFAVADNAAQDLTHMRLVPISSRSLTLSAAFCVPGHCNGTTAAATSA